MATDTRIIKPPEPKFGINEVVYLRESAINGYLEPVKVYRLRYDPEIDMTIYTFIFKRGAAMTQIAGDAINLKSSHIIELSEDNLLNLVDALLLKKSFLENELAKTNQMISNIS